MNAISAATIVFGAVLLWMSSICYGQTPEKCTSCSSQSPCQLGLSESFPATSCQEIYKGNPYAPSGKYWLRRGRCPTTNVTEQYCNMDGTYDGIKGGWLRVAYWDMEDTGTSCPSPLQETNPGKRLCIKSSPTGCTSVRTALTGYHTLASVAESGVIHTTLQMPLAKPQDQRTLTVLTQMVCPSPTGALASTCGRTQQDCKRKQTWEVIPVLVGQSLVTYHLPL